MSGCRLLPTRLIRKKRIFLRFMRLKDENCKKISDKSKLELFTELLTLSRNFAVQYGRRGKVSIQ